jgi:threonine/homoserine/homoserine lactone efflux protein
MDLTAIGLTAGALRDFVVASALIELTPGPNMTWLAIVAAGSGRARGYAAVAGVALGLTVIGVAAAAGFAAVVTDRVAVYQALRWAGVAYLLWFAWDAWRDAGAPDLSATDITLGAAFGRGLVTNLLNPKAALFYVAVLPGFAGPPPATLPATLTLTAVYVAVATLIHAGIVTMAGAARVLLQDPVRERRVRRALALALAGVALWFAWASRTGLPA